MASFYLKLRDDAPNRYGDCAIRLYITIDRKAKPVATGYSVNPKQWDDVKQRIKSNHPNYIEWNDAIEEIVRKAKENYSILQRGNGSTTSAVVASVLKHGDLFKDIALQYASQFKEDGREGDYRRCIAAINVIEELYSSIKIGDLDNNWVKRFRKDYKMSHNTVVSKLKFVFTVLNYAVAEKIFPYNPMAAVKKGDYRPSDAPRLTPKEIELIWNYIPFGRWNTIAKQTLMFSYYARGARLTDVLTMPKSAIYKEDGKLRLRWQMHKTKKKTGKINDMEVNKRLEMIIEQADNKTPTIFGIIDPKLSPAEAHKLINKSGTMINREFKNILLQCGIGKDVSFNDIRRSFLKHVQDISKDIYGTKAVAGHSKVDTTAGYVGEDQNAIDNLLKKVYG